MNEKVQKFVVETYEILEELERSLIILEKDSSRTQLLDEVYRKVHTIKGTCGFLELDRLETIYHHVETILERMREGEGIIPENVSLSLDGLRYTQEILTHLEHDGHEPEGNDDEILARLQGKLEEHKEAQVSNNGQEARGGEPSPGGKLVEKEALLQQRSIKVDVDILERIMNLVGELVLTRNEFLEHSQGEFDSKYFSPIQKLDFVTSNLQNETMKTRMQPVQHIWDKLPSIIRDGCKKKNKQIALKMKGQDTEMDRQVLQSIHDPFIHIIRNVIDHGIETPEERLKRQKPAEGTIFLKAFHEGGHIILEVEDDGAGIDLEAVKQKAIEKKLVDPEDAKKLSEKEVMEFIFEPGFSTADELSNLSGRGMGMNIVKSDIDKIGGAVEIHSTLGKGTVIRIKIPLTLAILSALIFSADGQSFAIPQTSILELVRIDENNRKLLGHVLNTKMLRLRDTSLPLVTLREVLDMETKYYYESKEEFFILVLQVGKTHFGIIVDDVQNTQEIVVKPLGRVIEKIQVYSGATILGDGMVILIVEPVGILEKMEVAGLAKTLEEADTELDTKKDKKSETGQQEMTNFLLFRGSGDDPMAVPLSLVARLEEVPRAKIELSKEQYVMQYRETVLPLVPVDGNIKIAEEVQPIIVFSDGERQMGLMVTSIEDIVEGVLKVTEVGDRRDDAIGICILGGDTRGVIDLNYYLQKAYPDWFELERLALQDNRNTKILIVDDSSFFRELLKPALEAKGFVVKSVENGKEALKVLQAADAPRLVVSDLVMPQLDGFGLASEIRKNSDLKEVKLIALTSLMEEKDRQKALSAGFDEYLVKFNQEEFLEKVKNVIHPQKSHEPKN